MRRALVTGWAGFIGSHLAEALVSQGIEVVGVDCAPPRFGEIATLTDSPLFQPVDLDLSRDPLAEVVSGCDVAFHLAARPGVRGSWGGDFDGYVAANITATQRLLECCWRQRIPRVILASSSSVYGATIGPSCEDDDCRPMSPYGVTKLAAEQLALAYARRTDSPLSVVALRYFTAYGPRQRPDMVLGRLLFAAFAGVPLTLFGDGTQRRDFTYVSDVVTATIAAARLDCQEEVINVGGGASVSLIDAISIASHVIEAPIPLDAAPAQPGDVPVTSADLQTAYELLGYKPKIGLAEGLTMQAEWLRRLDPVHLRVFADEFAGEPEMTILCGDSTAELFTAAARLLLAQGTYAAPRGMATREVLGVHMHMARPRRRLIHLPPQRVLNPAFAVAEAVWIISGSDDSWIFDFNSQLAQYTDNGVLQGAYGPRLRRWHGVDQLDLARRQLLADRHSRRAVVTLFDPARDHNGHSDVPCTLGFRFFLRDNRLHMHTTMRSQDLWLGFGYDVFTFTLIQELMAGWIGADLGEYRHSVDSLHLYAQHWDASASLLASGQGEEMAPIGVAWPALDSTLAAVVNGEHHALGDTGWATFAQVMDGYRCWRAGDRDTARAKAAATAGLLGEALRGWYKHLAPEIVTPG